MVKREEKTNANPPMVPVSHGEVSNGTVSGRGALLRTSEVDESTDFPLARRETCVDGG
jgi:hypothetical protein